MKKYRYNDPRAQGLPASQIDWSPSSWFRLFGETKIFRLFIIGGLLFWGIIGYIILHFLLKYW